MAKLNLSQAAKAVGKNRTTIWRHINSGKLSSSKDHEGMPFVDTSELLRVYGELKCSATPKKEVEQQVATPDYSYLVKVIEQLKQEQGEMKEQLKNLTYRLENKGKEQLIEPGSIQDLEPGKPEEDPEWPREVKTMNDLMVRLKIKSKYQK